MSQPTISVIVPVYNVEKYLGRCIDSIIHQTFQDLEIILIDDGSKDGSGILCDKYSQEDSRIKVIHKSNGGLSDARNVGIDVAKGRWIGFVDSDDFIENTMYEDLYTLAIAFKSDISVCAVYDCYDQRKIPQSSEGKKFLCSGCEALKLTLEGKTLAGTICNKLIKAEIIKDKRFLVGKTYEDAFFTPALFLDAKRVACTSKPLYNYWHRIDSITTQRFSVKRLDVIKAYEYTREVIEKRCPELMQFADFRLYWSYFVVLDSMLLEKKFWKLKQYAEIVNFLKENWIVIAKNPLFQKSRRIAVIALKINVWLYKALSTLHNTKKRIIE